MQDNVNSDMQSESYNKALLKSKVGRFKIMWGDAFLTAYGI